MGKRAVEQGFLRCLCCVIMVFDFCLTVYGNAEGDALSALKASLSDPNNVLTSWNATLDIPCEWFHVTCNNDNSVVRIDLENANLSGKLVSNLSQLVNLQYLEFGGNELSGIIPPELGNLQNLVSLDLYLNKLEGPIPSSMGKLGKLRFLRLNNNSLTGTIPASLTTISTLEVLDLSYNRLSGVIPVNGSFSRFNQSSFQGNENLTVPQSPLPGTPEASSADGNSTTGAAGAALLLAIVIAYCQTEEEPEVLLALLKRFSLRLINTHPINHNALEHFL